MTLSGIPWAMQEKVFHRFTVKTALPNRQHTTINFEEIFALTREPKSEAGVINRCTP